MQAHRNPKPTVGLRSELQEADHKAILAKSKLLARQSPGRGVIGGRQKRATLQEEKREALDWLNDRGIEPRRVRSLHEKHLRTLKSSDEKRRNRSELRKALPGA